MSCNNAVSPGPPLPPRFAHGYGAPMTRAPDLSLVIRSALIAAWLGAAPPATAQGPADVPRWNDTRWGTTRAEFVPMAILGGIAVVPGAGGEIAFIIPDYPVYDMPFEVLFGWTDENLLSRVILSSESFAENGQVPDPFSSIEKIVTVFDQRYGAHETLEDEGGPEDPRSLLVRWTFPSTVITLSYRRAEANANAVGSGSVRSLIVYDWNRPQALSPHVKCACRAPSFSATL